MGVRLTNLTDEKQTFDHFKKFIKMQRMLGKRKITFTDVQESWECWPQDIKDQIIEVAQNVHAGTQSIITESHNSLGVLIPSTSSSKATPGSFQQGDIPLKVTSLRPSQNSLLCTLTWSPKPSEETREEIENNGFEHLVWDFIREQQVQRQKQAMMEKLTKLSKMSKVQMLTVDDDDDVEQYTQLNPPTFGAINKISGGPTNSVNKSSAIMGSCRAASNNKHHSHQSPQMCRLSDQLLKAAGGMDDQGNEDRYN